MIFHNLDLWITKLFILNLLGNPRPRLPQSTLGLNGEIICKKKVLRKRKFPLNILALCGSYVFGLQMLCGSTKLLRKGCLKPPF